MRDQKSQVVDQEWWCLDLGQGELLDRDRFDRLTESLLRFTPDLVQGRNRIFLEMSRTRKHLKLSGVFERIRALGARLGLEGGYWRLGVGSSIPDSWVQTRWRTLDLQALPLDAYYDYISPLDFFELNRGMRERLGVFRALGMKTLASLFSIPKEAWLVRFGEEFDLFLENREHGRAFSGTRFIAAIPLTSAVHWNPEDCVLDAEPMIFRLKPVLDQLCERLYALHLSFKRVEVVLRLDRKGADRKIDLPFSFPQTSRVLILKLLRERLFAEMSRHPLSDPVVSASITVLETAKRQSASGRFAFSAEEEAIEERGERWMELVSYLGLKMEDRSRIFQAEVTEHPLPERSWKKILSSTPDEKTRSNSISALLSKRPTRLLSDPPKLFRLGPYLKHEQALWMIREISDGERLSGWDWDVEDTSGFDRSYYRVKVENGGGLLEEWWIYKDEREGVLRLHGVY